MYSPFFPLQNAVCFIYLTYSSGPLLLLWTRHTVAAAVNTTDSTDILPCQSVMLKQDELAFFKPLSTLHRRMVMSKKKKKTPTVSAGRRSAPSECVSRASNRITGKRKGNELDNSGDSSEPANRRPATGAGSKPLPANISATGEQAASSSRQPGPSGVGATYAAVLAANAAPSLPSGTLKPTAKDSSECGVSTGTPNRRMSDDMSGPLSGMPNDTTTNACLPAGQRPNKTPIFISGAKDTRAFLAWLRASCPGGLMAQLVREVDGRIWLDSRGTACRWMVVLIESSLGYWILVALVWYSQILPCRSVMLRQDELACIKALSTLQRKLATFWKKVPTVSSGRRQQSFPTACGHPAPVAWWPNWREVDGRPINSGRFPSCGHCAAGGILPNIQAVL